CRPVFLDVNRDGIPDAFIGGRSSEFMAIDGKSGEIVWKFEGQPAGDGTMRENEGFYNFYNAQIIPDQTGDGLDDLLVSAGGGGISFSPDDRDRYPGMLMILDAATGREWKVWKMPDGKETY